MAFAGDRRGRRPAVPERPRRANACAATAVGVAFLVRGVGDALGERAADGIQVTSAWPSWLSPIGWGTQVRPYGDERWWVLALPVALFVACVGSPSRWSTGGTWAPGCCARPARPGDRVAALLSPLGLAWRLNRGATARLGDRRSPCSAWASARSAPRSNDAMAGNAGAAELLDQLAGAAPPTWWTCSSPR